MPSNKKSSHAYEDGFKEFWRDCEMPPPLPRDEVKRAVTFQGHCRIPQAWRPIWLLFRNEELYDFFAVWPSDVVPVIDIERDPRRMFSEAPKRGVSLHGSGSVTHFIKDWSEAEEVFSELFTQPSNSWKVSLRRQIAQTPGQYHSALHVGLLFEPIYWLRGMEQFFVDLYEHRDEIERLLDKLLDLQITTAKVYADVGCDGILTSDDWGSQRNLLIDPDLWRGFYKPRYKVFVDAVHAAGLDVTFHSDGNLDSIFPDIVEIGFDVFNPLQPGAMTWTIGSRSIKEESPSTRVWTCRGCCLLPNPNR